MTIEYLKAEWHYLKRNRLNLTKTDFADKYMDKLLAVVEAAQTASVFTECLEIGDRCPKCQLLRALDGLLEDK